MKKHRKEVYAFFMGVIVTLLLVYAGTTLGHIYQIHPLDHSLGTKVGDKINVLDRYIDKMYWKDVDDQVLEEGALKGMVDALGDKYSFYFTEKEYEDLRTSLDGSYTGIGVGIREDKDGRMMILSVFEGGAKKAGIKPGDEVISVNGESMKGKDLDLLTKRIKGEKDTKVTLGVLRDGKELSFEVVRSQIKNQSIGYRMLSKEVGYIRISDFDNESPKQFTDAIDALEKKEQKAMVIDLRDNGGGTLTSVLMMLDEMLPEGKLLSVKEKDESKNVTYTTDSKKQFTKPVVILINGNTASASEVFAGAMQDHKAATLVGEKSFGKGIVQSIIDLKKTLGEGALKITTARYYLPSGRCIHEVGLTPDVEIPYTGSKEQYEEGKDNQLTKALEIANSKISNEKE